jgi:hypothetical protein
MLEQKAREASALRLGQDHEVCVVMACQDICQAEQVGQELLKVNSGRLQAYGRIRDLICNPPAGPVTSAIFATHEGQAEVRAALEWSRRRWPRCLVTVVGDSGCGPQERTAREGGALFLTRPVSAEQWSAIICHGSDENLS